MTGLHARIDDPPAYMFDRPPVDGPWYCDTRAAHAHSTEWEAHLCGELTRQVNRLSEPSCGHCGRPLICPDCECGAHCHHGRV
jgi:hypothetical protein